MSTVAIIAGYGFGISHPITNNLAQSGYKLALISRTQSKLDKSSEEFEKKGYHTKGYAADLSDSKEVIKTVETIRKEFGSIGILFWNPSGTAHSVAMASPEDFQREFNLAVISLQAATKSALDDLKENQGAILVTGGGLSKDEDWSHDIGHSWKAATLAVPKAAQRKWVAIAHRDLKEFNIFVGENTVMGLVKGTAFDDGTEIITSQKVAENFAELLKARKEAFTMTLP